MSVESEKFMKNFNKRMTKNLSLSDIMKQDKIDKKKQNRQENLRLIAKDQKNQNDLLKVIKKHKSITMYDIKNKLGNSYYETVARNKNIIGKNGKEFLVLIN